MASNLAVGTRVEVTGRNVKGIVAFIGATEFADGEWVGVELSEPKGKNNGSVAGKSYFSCKDNHGLFVRPNQLVVVPSRPSTPKSKLPAPKASGIPMSRGTDKKAPPSTIKKKVNPSATSSANISESNSLHASTTSLAEKAEIEVPLTTPVSKMPEPVSSSAKLQGSIREPQTVSKPSNLPVISAGTAPSSVMSQSFVQSTNAASSQEIKALKAEVDELKNAKADVEEKLEALKVKRQEDKAKLLMLQQLTEFKQKMTEAHSQLQKKLQQEKNSKQEIQEDYNRYKEEMADTADMIEMATLDKEMAEEKCETLEKENAELKESQTDLQKKLNSAEEQLKAFASGTGGAGSEEAQKVVGDYHNQQLKEENEKLREAVILLKDMEVQSKHKNDQVTKQFESLEKSFESAKNDIEKLKQAVLILQEEKLDLQDQVDSAMGADEMIERLTEKNLDLEDALSKVQTERDEFEQLYEVTVELQEESKNLETKLRNDIEEALIIRTDLTNRLTKCADTLADYENSASQFRQLVADLREQVFHLQSKLDEKNSAANSMTSSSIANDVANPSSVSLSVQPFEDLMAQTKVQARAIDLELRELEVDELRRYVELQGSFLPDAFSRRGGEKDALQVCLTVRRVMAKAKLIYEKVREIFPLVLDPGSGMLSPRGDVPLEQMGFAFRIQSLLSSLQLLLRHFDFALSKCPVDLFLKIGTLSPEMVAHEVSLGLAIELLKKNRLDETTPLEPLQRSVDFFSQLWTVHVEPTSLLDLTNVIPDCFESLIMHSETLMYIGSFMKNQLPSRDVTTDIAELFSDIVTYSSQLRSTCKTARMQRLRSSDPLKSTLQIASGLMTHTKNIELISSAVSRIFDSVLVRFNTSLNSSFTPESSAGGLTAKTLEEISLEFCTEVLGRADLGPYDEFRKVSEIVEYVKQLSIALENGDLDVKASTPTTPTPQGDKGPTAEDTSNNDPISVRARQWRAELSNTEILRDKLQNKEKDLQELRKLVKSKQEQIVELETRLQRADKRINDVCKDSEDRVERLQSKIDELSNQTVRRDHDYDSKFEALHQELATISQERNELKLKLRNFSEMSLLKGAAASVASSPATPAASPLSLLATSNAPRTPSSRATTALHIAELEDELAQAKRMLVALSTEVRALKRKIALKDMDVCLKRPLFVHKTESDTKSLEVLEDELLRLQTAYSKWCTTTVLPDISKGQSATKFIEQRAAQKLHFAHQFSVIKAQVEKARQQSMGLRSPASLFGKFILPPVLLPPTDRH